MPFIPDCAGCAAGSSKAFRRAVPCPLSASWVAFVYSFLLIFIRRTQLAMPLQFHFELHLVGQQSVASAELIDGCHQMGRTDLSAGKLSTRI